MWNRLGFPRLLNRLGFKKRSGTSAVDVVYLLLLWVWLKVDSIAMFSRESLLSFSSAHKDALYDMLNREDLNWRKLQLHIALKLIATTEKNSTIRALVVDDSVKMRRGKKMPGVSCHFDHLTGGRGGCQSNKHDPAGYGYDCLKESGTYQSGSWHC